MSASSVIVMDKITSPAPLPSASKLGSCIDLKMLKITCLRMASCDHVRLKKSSEMNFFFARRLYFISDESTEVKRRKAPCNFFNDDAKRAQNGGFTI